MAVSVVTLKTGERIITELKEIFDGEGDDKKGVCLLMEEPCLLYTSPSPRDKRQSRMPSSA